MSKTRSNHALAALLSAFLLTSVLLSCSGEKDVPYVVDEDQLIRYVQEVSEARELFRTSHLIQTEPYTVPFDDGSYSDSLLERRRRYDVSLVPLNGNTDPYEDYGNLGDLREAMVEVTDSLLVQRTREYADTTLYDTTWRELVRYGFFLKLGDDAKDYVGWSLWGYNGLGFAALPVSVEARRYDLSTFPCDLEMYTEFPKGNSITRVPFVRLSNIDTVVIGSRLRFSNEKLSAQPAVYTLLSDYTTDGAFQAEMPQESADIDTLSYKTENSTSRYYRVAFMQAFKESDGQFVGCWCVPYRR